MKPNQRDDQSSRKSRHKGQYYFLMDSLVHFFSPFDQLAKSQNPIKFVIPAKAGIQGSR
jgi:hypothetical protein